MPESIIAQNDQAVRTGRTWPDVLFEIYNRARWTPWAFFSFLSYGVMGYSSNLKTWKEWTIATAATAVVIAVGVVAHRFLAPK